MIHFSLNDILTMEKVPRLKLINAVSGFKSANLIGTVSRDGQENVAIFSSSVHVGSNPPLLGFITRPETVPRHTYENIQDTEIYTINHVSEALVHKAHQTSGKYRQDISEFEECGLTPSYSADFDAPYVEGAPVQMGLKFVEEHYIQSNGTVLVVGEIQELRLQEGIRQDDGDLNLPKAQTVALSGIETYHRAQPIAELDYVRVTDEKSRE